MSEIIEGTAVEISNELAPTRTGDWAGDLPVFLIFEPEDQEGGNIGIDLDVEGWIEGNRDTFRRPGVWFLMSKVSGDPLLCLPTVDGDQFYYHRHHVGIIGSTVSPTVAIHVIGKKQADGSMSRLWLLPNGMVMTGEEAEVDPIATRMIGM